ncbi:ribosome maturation factor RimP [Friedmanniella endophytica]|uniref:Ribosome maturation factor RimP n=1 Tax=Microlunatus kandeliicorticis TaxID=1759536 RepID=A0A7W3P7Q2_9ACTN|nr:ribosome maturation factor RimP [Microlunatus kandeliicorticis]MBA8796273.1 ribosome maturation factor RimP [Microlunatus kandeliicorticis]
MRSDALVELLAPVAGQFALELEEVDVVPAGKRRLVRVVVDGEGPDGRGPLLDDIAEATKAISTALDDTDLMGAGAYTLEVSSRGVSRPLTLPRHWRRNEGRLVEVRRTEGDTVTGRIRSADDDGVDLDVDGTSRRLGYAEVDRALVQIELNRKTDDDE